MLSVKRILRDYEDAGSVNSLISLWGFVDDAAFLTKAGHVGIAYNGLSPAEELTVWPTNGGHRLLHDTIRPVPDRVNARFETTRWSLIVAATGSQSAAAKQALAELCESYWYPLYAYVRRQGQSIEDAQDAVQSFILLLLDRQDLQGLRPERGRFRSFLLVSLRNFLSNRRDHDQALKRGGGEFPVSLEFGTAESRYLLEPLDAATPETFFDRNWAVAVLDQAFGRIKADWDARGKSLEFERLKACLMGELPDEGYKAVAAESGTTEAAVKMAVHRLRRRFEQELRSEVADTVTDNDVDDELRTCFAHYRDSVRAGVRRRSMMGADSPASRLSLRSPRFAGWRP